MWIFSQNETGCVLGAFCGTSERQQLSQTKKSLSSVLVLPAGLSLSSFNTDLQPVTEKTKSDGKKQWWDVTDVFRQILIRRHPLIKNCGIHSNLDHHEENKAATQHCFTTITSRDCYLFSQKRKQDCLSAKLTLQCDSWSKQLKRKAGQRLGKSVVSWLWWDKMGSPQDAYCSYLSSTVTLILPGMSSEIVKALIKD